eukprot:TRINITY_DN182389_c0_g1_i4.p1 TRINITY_DN182389_c0_g1~~TRINITY_DN182389_c0_g1_i4.p1  ORF type:complete len:199 (+),score=33.74 TRINITY_DN182389_c0_g1_i4:369-965(+)
MQTVLSNKTNKLAIVILAAGKSSRLGEPKQLLKIDGETLLKNTVKKALTLSDDVKVVLGANSSLCKEQIKDFDVDILENKDFDSGMASSLKLGISSIKEKTVLIMLCDMPLVPITHYEKLIEKYFENQELIVCSKYKNDFFVPAIFPYKYLDEFKKLSGDKGAKKIIMQNPKEFVLLDDKYSLDIDTKEDFKKVLATK